MSFQIFFSSFDPRAEFPPSPCLLPGAARPNFRKQDEYWAIASNLAPTRVVLLPFEGLEDPYPSFMWKLAGQVPWPFQIAFPPPAIDSLPVRNLCLSEDLSSVPSFFETPVFARWVVHRLRDLRAFQEFHSRALRYDKPESPLYAVSPLLSVTVGSTVAMLTVDKNRPEQLTVYSLNPLILPAVVTFCGQAVCEIAANPEARGTSPNFVSRYAKFLPRGFPIAIMNIIDTLESIGWFQGFQNEYRERVVHDLSKSLESSAETSYLAFALFRFDPECIEGEWPDPRSYGGVIRQFASSSNGHFAPESITDHRNPPRTRNIGFQLAGLEWRTKVKASDDWFHPKVFDLINAALGKANTRKRFFMLPPIDQIAYVVLVEPAVYAAAENALLIPRGKNFA